MDIAVTEGVGTAERQREPLPFEVVRGADQRLYRRSAQVFIVNENGLFLGCTPVGGSNRNFRQTVQGGVEKGEAPLNAGKREMREEIGLDPEDTVYVGPVFPLNYNEASAPAVNTAGEMVDETRALFRYPSKSWKHMGISGQELFPFLFHMHSSVIGKINFTPSDTRVRREFRAATWLPLEHLALMAPDSKKNVMENITVCVHPVAHEYLVSHVYPGMFVSSIRKSPYYIAAISKMTGQQRRAKRKKRDRNGSVLGDATQVGLPPPHAR